MARTYMSGHYASGSCGEFSAGGRRGVGDTHTRGWNAGVAVEVRAHAGERDRFEVYMTPGSSGSGHRVLLGTVHDTPDGPHWEAAEDRTRRRRGSMTHTWKAAGSGGRWVHHSSRADGTGSDSIGVGLGEDVLGPFTSRKMARVVADALNNAYQLGKKDGLPDDTAEMLDRAYAAMDPDEGSNDAEHESLLELTELVANLADYVYQPLDGKTLIAGVLYDEDGYESEEDEELAQVPEHHNDLGDWCPDSGSRTADGTCPQSCKEADDIVGFDTGRDDDDNDDDEEPTVTVEGTVYPVLPNGDVICPECGAARSQGRIADHMASEHDDDTEYDDNDMENPYPQDREDGEGLGLTRPSYGS